MVSLEPCVRRAAEKQEIRSGGWRLATNRSPPLGAEARRMRIGGRFQPWAWGGIHWSFRRGMLRALGLGSADSACSC